MIGQMTVDFNSTSNNLFLMVQTKKEIVVQELDKKAQVKRFPTLSEVAMVKNVLATSVKQNDCFSVFFHSQIGGLKNQQINILSVNQKGLVNIIMVLQFKYGHLSLQKLACFKEELIILDDVTRIHKYQYNLRNDKLKHTHEMKFIEEVRMILDQKPELSENLFLTEQGMHVGPFFYRYLKKSLAIKDSEMDFEIFRLKMLSEQMF